MFEEVDKLILRCKEEQEMKDYLERNIYPERLKNNFVYKHIPPIQETHLPDIQYIEKEDNNSYYLDIKNKLNTIDNLIYSLNNVVDNSHETCPICICEINDTNIIIPSCGHKTCIGCFVSNLSYNKHTGNLCSICRTSIID
uniref:RING-type domain-containing protein n=1 Tax=viral metagenome TaxID=1070528 RepID=A0A6C0AWS7_9ZZZZ|tara:strand:+ start:78 stop:500 length:423 start_codon:yes stop_codon:yes gene_type:complete